MDVGTVLLHVLVVLVAAKVGAELSERLGQPAVLGELVVGVLIGPSVLGLVGGDQVLAVLGELGVLLLLLQVGVGLETELTELLRVGRPALSVAAAGVVAGRGMDKALVGFGMLPRGEVGLVFASIGLRLGVIDRDAFSTLLLVVLATTFVTPPLLRWRSTRHAPARLARVGGEGGQADDLFHVTDAAGNLLDRAAAERLGSALADQQLLGTWARG